MISFIFIVTRVLLGLFSTVEGRESSLRQSRTSQQFHPPFSGGDGHDGGDRDDDDDHHGEEEEQLQQLRVGGEER